MGIQKMNDTMINWAKKEVDNDRYAGWHLSFIKDALDISNYFEIFGGDSAKELGEMYSDALQKRMPARGELVFYDYLCISDDGPVNWEYCGDQWGTSTLHRLCSCGKGSGTKARIRDYGIA